MKTNFLVGVLIGLALAASSLNVLQAAEQDGVALAIIYDTSGSMKDAVADRAGKSAPKYVIANRALEAVAGQIQSFATNAAAGGPRNIYTCLYTFQGERPREAIKFAPFDAAALRNWARSFANPNGSTPLGNALSAAGHAVLASPLSRKHVLVLTDGMNTAGPDPARTLPRLQKQASEKGTSVSVHFVAFDVDAKVFDPLKRLGATVVSAADENQLNSQLQFILQRKILLEEEEAPKPK